MATADVSRNNLSDVQYLHEREALLEIVLECSHGLPSRILIDWSHLVKHLRRDLDLIRCELWPYLKGNLLAHRSYKKFDDSLLLMQYLADVV